MLGIARLFTSYANILKSFRKKCKKRDYVKFFAYICRVKL
jgi:hypothetical protein